MGRTKGWGDKSENVWTNEEYLYGFRGTLSTRSSIRRAHLTGEGVKCNLIYNKWSQIWIFEVMMNTEIWK
jgi:hypothetical protein